MNKTKIEWTDYTWNPITGCLNGCFYCYGRKIYERFKKDFTPQIHYDRLSQPLKCKTPSKIFVCSVADFWGKGVLPIWREEVYNVIKACPEHTFQILTKQPQNITDTDRIPNNVWIGQTSEGNKLYPPIKGYINFISFEPLLYKPDYHLHCFDWIIVGAMTGQGSEKYRPKKEWVENIIKQARESKIPIFIKNNVGWKKKIQELPKADYMKGGV